MMALGYVWFLLGEGTRAFIRVAGGILWLFAALIWGTGMFKELDAGIRKRLFGLDLAACAAGAIVGYVVSGIDSLAYGLFLCLLLSEVLTAVYFIFFAPYSRESDEGNPEALQNG